jgi:hypothetical protein
MKVVSKQWIGKLASTTIRVIVGNFVFYSVRENLLYRRELGQPVDFDFD